MKKVFMFLFALAVVLGFSVIAHATLWDRGGGLIYDDVQNITWLQDANLPATNTFGVSGIREYGGMSWYEAQDWIAAMNDANYLGYSDWRLPKTVDGLFTWGYDGTTTAGYRITTSEMGYMYYVNLSNIGMHDTNGSIDPNWNPTPNPTFVDGNGKTVSFLNIWPYFYWSDTTYSLTPIGAWGLEISAGEQSWDSKERDVYYAWAVRDGDVAPVPEPSTMLLLGSGLLGLWGFRKKFRN